MSKIHNISSINFTCDSMTIEIDNGNCSFKLGVISEVLKKATNEQRTRLTISSSGYGISWTVLDEDISIDGLLI